MAERLSGGNQAIALLANTIATGAALVALILTFGPISGAHFNPAVTLADASQGGLAWRRCAGYIVRAVVAARRSGVWAAHAMFGAPLFMLSSTTRSGAAQLFSEFVATFGLLAVIWGCSRRRAATVPFAVGAYITAAYWFTASTSFANPAVTLARALTDTFAGIRPLDVPGFIVAQLAGAAAATLLFRWLVPAFRERRQTLSCHASEASAMKTVLFACVHNAGRSQMAAAWFNVLADPAKARAVSAGTRSGATGSSGSGRRRCARSGSISRARRRRNLTPDVAQTAQMLVTMGCGDACPVVPGAKRDDWPLEDPKGKPIDEVREIRDEIRDRVQALIAAEGF